MDIAGAGLAGLGYDMIDQSDNGCIAGIVQKICRVFDLAEDIMAVFLHSLHQLLGRIPAEIIGHVDKGKNRLFC